MKAVMLSSSAIEICVALVTFFLSTIIPADGRNVDRRMRHQGNKPPLRGNANTYPKSGNASTAAKQNSGIPIGNQSAATGSPSSSTGKTGRNVGSQNGGKSPVNGPNGAQKSNTGNNSGRQTSDCGMSEDGGRRGGGGFFVILATLLVSTISQSERKGQRVRYHGNRQRTANFRVLHFNHESNISQSNSGISLLKLSVGRKVASIPPSNRTIFHSTTSKRPAGVVRPAKTSVVHKPTAQSRGNATYQAVNGTKTCGKKNGTTDIEMQSKKIQPTQPKANTSSNAVSESTIQPVVTSQDKKSQNSGNLAVDVSEVKVEGHGVLGVEKCQHAVHVVVRHVPFVRGEVLQTPARFRHALLHALFRLKLLESFINGEALDFTDWKVGQPDSPGTEHCIVLYQGDWKDWICHGIKD
ncbi:hypothetical protein B566_EDAN017877, partial [Ephemera danica]